MIELIEAQVWKYKSIEDSTAVAIGPRVTVLVGKNEAGKTAFLEALHKSIPLDSVKFDIVFDYPRKDLFTYRPKHDAKQYANVVQLTYRAAPALVDKINQEVFGGATVIPKGYTFRRSVNYNNGAIISVNLDEATALTALKARLAGVEHVDEAFASAGKLADVLAKIDTLKLPGEHKLAQFAAQWRTWYKDATAGWDFLDWHLWHAYLYPALPMFLYFDDYQILEGKINLDSLAHKRTHNQLTPSDQTVLGLFELAGITLDELRSEEGYEQSKAKLEAIGLNITHQVFTYWKQNPDLTVEFDVKADPSDQPPYNSGKNLYIRIKSARHGVTVAFGQRSKGFIWFFSFIAWFSSVQNRVKTEEPLVLLLDEPGLNLHALAQADFLAYIDALSEGHQIIFSTHSPFMVESDHLENVRVVEDRPKEGTRITSNLEGSSEESLFPLQAALGYSIAQNLFIGKRNLAIEGPADLVVLQHMSTLLEEAGETGLDDVVLVPVGGLDKLATFVALLGANKLHIAVLHDRAGGAPHQKLEDLVQQKLIERKRVLDYSMFREPASQEADLEDMFPANIYVQAFNAAYTKELAGKVLTVAALPTRPRIVARIDAWLEQEKLQLLKDGGFNHYRVAQALLPMLAAGKVDPATMASFKKLSDRVNKILR